MTSKERMLIALSNGKPDRLPVTIHQWQPYHHTSSAKACLYREKSDKNAI
jgi:hypothetical protein